MKINQLNGLNRQARKFLVENLITVKNYPVLGCMFNGFINGMERINVTIERKNGKWYHFSTGEEIKSIKGKISHFLIKN